MFFSTIGINAQVINTNSIIKSNNVLHELLILEIFITIVTGFIIYTILSIVLQIKTFNKIQALKQFNNFCQITFS